MNLLIISTNLTTLFLYCSMFMFHVKHAANMHINIKHIVEMTSRLISYEMNELIPTI